MSENESSARALLPVRTTGLAADVPAAVRVVVERLCAAGHRALLVGGSVRDLCLRRAPVDQDIATSASADAVRMLFADAVPTGERFGSVAVSGGAGDLVEVTAFRREGPYSDGRHPDWIAPAGDEQEDAVRRDFTVNALYLDVLADRLIDPVGGVPDLRAGILRAIGDAHARLCEDALRSLRAVRLQARYDLRLEPTLAAALSTTAGGLARLSAERVRTELTLLWCGEGAGPGLERLSALGLLAVVLPELPAGSVPGAARWLGQLAERDPVDGWSAVLHALAPEPAAAVLGRLHAPRALGRAVAERLSDWSLVARFAELTRAEQARWLARPGLDRTLLWLAAGSQAVPGTAGVMAAVHAARAMLPAPPDQPLVTGRDVMALGIPPGPRVGAILRAVTERVLAGELRDREQALAAARALAAGPEAP